jgi:hypothetical protein
LGTASYDTQQPRGPELSYDLDEDQEQPHQAQPLPQAIKAEHLKPLAPLRRHKLVKSVVALLILVGLAAIISWQWPHFSELYRSVAQTVAKHQSDQTVPQTASQLSFLDRFPGEQGTAAPSHPGHRKGSAGVPRLRRSFRSLGEKVSPLLADTVEKVGNLKSCAWAGISADTTRTQLGDDCCANSTAP